MRNDGERKKRWAYAFVLAATMLSGSSSAGGGHDAGRLQKSVLYSDLVIHGVIASLGSQMVPRDSVFAPLPTDKEFPITVIEVKVQDVLKGPWAKPTIRAVLTGDPKKGGYVAENTYDYEIGQEVVLCLHYDPRILGGAYRLWGDSDSFVRRGEEWRTRGPNGDMVSFESIVQETGLAAPPRMIDAADAVVLGSIEHIEQREFNCGFDIPCMADYVTVRVNEAWKGAASVGDVILVRALRRGTNLAWYAPVPRFSAGETYLMFLKQDDVGFYPFVGFNGVLKVDGERLIMNGHVPYSASTSRMRMTIQEEIAR